MDAQPNGTPPTQMVSIGAALINPPWQGHLVALSDNGGDLVMISVDHPEHGMIRCLYPRAQAGAIRDWLSTALQQPVLQPAQQQAQPQQAQQAQQAAEPENTQKN